MVGLVIVQTATVQNRERGTGDEAPWDTGCAAATFG